MALLNTDNSLGIKVKDAVIKIAYYTVNRTGFFNEDGTPRFAANLYLEYRQTAESDVYFRKDITIVNLKESELDFSTFYSKMKEIEEFQNAKDSIPEYEPIEEIVSEPETTGPEEVTI